jgi:multimeric flavodoxin WrbA
MVKVLAINGSPTKGKGNTASVLEPFLQGLRDAGAEVELLYASNLKIKPCSCGSMYCWYSSPGKCCFDDDMQLIYQNLKAAEILIFATPVYIPLPGTMQDVINRLCPLVEPHLEFREGRTRARFRQDVNIKKILLVATGGWWEKENMSTLVRIVDELAKDVGVEFGGAILRPHAFLMRQDGQLTKEGAQILEELRRVGSEFILSGHLTAESLEKISRPLISEQDLRQRYNQMI